MYPEAAGDLTCLPIAKDEFQAVLPVDHPFASRPSVSLAEMAAESLIVVEEGQLNTVLDTYEKNGLSPNVKFRIHDDYTILSMVEAGNGVSILPSMILERATGYRFRTVPLDQPIRRTIGVAFPREDLLPIAAKRFIRFLLDNVSKYLPAEYWI
jgi:DNA-binding transcriptional LysR family regulator